MKEMAFIYGDEVVAEEFVELSGPLDAVTDFAGDAGNSVADGANNLVGTGEGDHEECDGDDCEHEDDEGT
jgi:hypothetical protein